MMDPKGVSLYRSVDSKGLSGTSHKRQSTSGFFVGRKEDECDIDSESTSFPGELDVTCGRGKHRWNSIGNRRYKVIIMENINRYQEARTKCGKSKIVREVVKQVQLNKAKFLKRDQKTKEWKELTPTETRTKVAHALRDHIRSLGCCTTSSGTQLDFESESGESASCQEENRTESHNLKEFPNTTRNNATTEKSSSSQVRPPSRAIFPTGSSALRDESHDVTGTSTRKEQRKGHLDVLMAPSPRHPSGFLEALEDDQKQLSVGGHYLKLPPIERHHQACHRSLRVETEQWHQIYDDMSLVSQLSGIPLNHASSFACSLPSSEAYDPTSTAGNSHGDNPHGGSFRWSTRNLPGAMAMSSEERSKASSFFLQHEPGRVVSPLTSMIGSTGVEGSVAIRNLTDAHDETTTSSVANFPLPLGGYLVAKSKEAVSNNLSLSQLLGGNPMIGSHAVSPAMPFDSVCQGNDFPFLRNVDETNIVPYNGGRMMNDNSVFQSIYPGAALPTMNYFLGAHSFPLPCILNSVTSFPEWCDEDDTHAS